MLFVICLHIIKFGYFWFLNKRVGFVSGEYYSTATSWETLFNRYVVTTNFVGWCFVCIVYYIFV